jgi:Nucleotidyl transferase AbiEii toxin, Type IV TA system
VYPCESKTVLSYVEAQFKDILASDQALIKTLKPVRTFWEKITLLHAENHRHEGKEHGERLSRHYYDVYQMIGGGISKDAVKNLNILYDVIENKTRYFKSLWARYEEAVPRKLIIFPNHRLLPHLEMDYKNMNGMIFGKIPSFADILHSIKEFETDFNRLS